jgi:hypothetical protein
MKELVKSFEILTEVEKTIGNLELEAMSYITLITKH